MGTWVHERLLRRPQTEDTLSRRTRDVQDPSGACTFGLSLSSVKRYVNKAERGESLAPKKSPGSAAPKLDEKANKLLQDVLEERPFAREPPGPLRLQ